MQHSDLLVRYACHALCLRETAGGMLKVLGLVGEIFAMLKREGQMLHDSEVSCILPHLIDRAGHKSERHKAAFKVRNNKAQTNEKMRTTMMMITVLTRLCPRFCTS